MQINSTILWGMQNLSSLSLLGSISIGLMSIGLFCPHSLYAQDEVRPPPKISQQSLQHGISNIEERDYEPSLQKELAPPTQSDDGVSIHSYVRKNDKAEITEYSLHGRVFRIKVQPPGGLPAYYLEDSDGDGSFNKRLPGGYKGISPPMWVIQRF